jgi:hypothetical protein
MMKQQRKLKRLRLENLPLLRMMAMMAMMAHALARRYQQSDTRSVVASERRRCAS